MTRTPVTAHPQACGLFRGVPAVAFTLQAADHPAYVSALNTLDMHVTTVVRHRLARAAERIDQQRLPALGEYDLIRGLTGLGVYLLHRQPGGTLLKNVLSYLVSLTRPLQVDGEVLPGWWCGNSPHDQPSPQWAGGHANLGMAHGIAGPLTLLSTAMRRRIIVTGHTEAISRICTWLDQCRRGTRSRPWWPGLISRTEWRTRTLRQASPTRPSWCYGTPGLARAQQLAALALGDATRQRLAEDALAACITDDQQLCQLRGASVCHGWAGLIHATWRTAALAVNDELTTHLPGLLTRMEQLHDHHGPRGTAGLLTGATGVELVRHTVTADRPPASRWDACLLLDT